MSDIQERLKAVQEKIEQARIRSSYHQKVSLVAVTKFHPVSEIEEAIRCGAEQIGENRVQEMESKRKMIRTPVVWNLIGHLQKNKVRKAVALSDLIQSADSMEILRDIDEKAGQMGKKQSVLLEFNISGEASKHGIPPEEAGRVFHEAGMLPHISVRGLMCMAPLTEDLNVVRKVFRQGKLLWEYMKDDFPEGQISVLSMGMTHDFEIAIEEGSTMVRVGTAIFGPRPQKGEQ
jgi:pyridoxal phosphate enzyme (YggS family)